MSICRCRPYSINGLFIKISSKTIAIVPLVYLDTLFFWFFLKFTIKVVNDFHFSTLGTIIISSEDPMDATFAEKTLKDLGVADGSILSCDDFLQDYDVKVIVYHR